MANPNIVEVTNIYGNTINRSATTVDSTLINNPSGSGIVIKVNNIVATNFDSANTVSFQVKYYSQADLGGTGNALIGYVPITPGTTLIAVDKNQSFYLPEDKSVSVYANVGNHISVTASWEEIS